MDKLRFMRLWDLYRNLLTDTQREITDMYFNLDLTVSEIAEQKGISRQGVSECLNGCKKQLEDYEAKLGFSNLAAASDLKCSFMLTELSKWQNAFFCAHPELEADKNKLDEIINKDYTAEVEKALNELKKV